MCRSRESKAAPQMVPVLLVLVPVNIYALRLTKELFGQVDKMLIRYAEESTSWNQ